MSAALLRELRARGLELRADGATLRVFGPPGAYTPNLRAQLLSSKRELLEQLREEGARAATQYDRDERAWASEYLRSMACARGYGIELAQVAADVVAKGPPRAPFRVERDAITISMGEGREVRVHREPQSWAGTMIEKP